MIKVKFYKEPLLGEINDAKQVLNKVENRLDKEDLIGNMSGKEFSLFMQELLVSRGGYVMDTGNWENANYACAYELLRKIEKHPIIWKLLFMVG